MDQRYSMKDFDIIRVIGKGYMGKVLVVKEKMSNEVYAIKSIHKKVILERKEVNHTRTERDILAELVTHHAQTGTCSSPFLIRLYAAFQDRSNVYYLMDFHGGGDLAGLLAQRIRLCENWVRFYAAQIVSGLMELHVKGIIYRDLKPENVLISRDGNLVLTDFGLSKFIGRDGATRTFCGTPEYLGPEVVLQQPYGIEVDWWSFGVLLYEMLIGMTPFWADAPAKMYSRIAELTPIIPSSVSPEPKDLIEKLLNKNPKRRIKGPDIMKHSFFAGVDWELLRALEYEPPFIPGLASGMDVGAFDPTFTNMPAIITPDNSGHLFEGSMAQRAFTGFSFKSDQCTKL